MTTSKREVWNHQIKHIDSNSSKGTFSLYHKVANLFLTRFALSSARLIFKESNFSHQLLFLSKVYIYFVRDFFGSLFENLQHINCPLRYIHKKVAKLKTSEGYPFINSLIFRLVINNLKESLTQNT